jgi:hypothetical protein
MARIEAIGPFGFKCYVGAAAHDVDDCCKDATNALDLQKNSNEGQKMQAPP